MNSFAFRSKTVALLSPLILGLAGGAQATVINNVDFGDNVYDPGVTAGKDNVPDHASATLPKWTAVSNSAPNTVSTIDDYFRIATHLTGETTSSARSYKQAAGLSSSVTAITVEFRMRVAEQEGSSTAASLLLINTADSTFTEIQLGGSKIFAGGSQLNGNYSIFHTFRLTVEPTTGGNQQLHLYQDGNTTPLKSFTRVSKPITEIRFGDFSSAATTTGTSDWDYIAWLPNQAIAVPEPTSLAAGLLLGGLSLRRRRTR